MTRLPKTTKLGITMFKFSVLDHRGRNGFPTGPRGIVYRCAAGADLYYIRSDEKGWRVDLQPVVGPVEAVYDEDRNSHWATAKDAAKALQGAVQREDEARRFRARGVKF